mmetsp:Transcript_7702/g.11113  ORF Transcript_7702/g.11113 Transcript_7702/m.11113 type:complete len:98 (+) Transcript_7702:38-331(+)
MWTCFVQVKHAEPPITLDREKKDPMVMATQTAKQNAQLLFGWSGSGKLALLLFETYLHALVWWCAVCVVASVESESVSGDAALPFAVSYFVVRLLPI